MEVKPSVKNGVLLVHHVEDGKHQYEVKNVVKTKKSSLKKLFVSGDKLMEVNGQDVQNLQPDELANMLADGNPMLTVHKPGKVKTDSFGGDSNKETLQPYSKEYTMLTFGWEMTRTDQDYVCEEEEFQREEVNESLEGKYLLVIEMTQTSISLVSGRGCDKSSPCQGCNGSGCIYNDIVVVAGSSKVTLVPRGSSSFKQENLLNVLVEHVPSQHYLHGVCSQKTVYASPNPERITIYLYKPNYVDSGVKGVPVVLNLTGSNCFLKCCRIETRVIIQVEVFEKQRLKMISRTDDTTLCFVFYMKGDQSGQRTFESALHNDWFLHVVNTDTVRMSKQDGQMDEESFLFVIQH